MADRQLEHSDAQLRVHPDRLRRKRDLRQEVVEGLLYAQSRLNANTGKALEAASFLYALIELLNERGLITIEELDERKLVVEPCMINHIRWWIQFDRSNWKGKS